MEERYPVLAWDMMGLSIAPAIGRAFRSTPDLNGSLIRVGDLNIDCSGGCVRAKVSHPGR
jgi:hypothetical protein